MRIRVSILLLCWLCVSNAWSQVRKYSYQQLTEEQGLAQNFAYGLSQDERGFLWIGTGIGLSRYDGYEMKNFTVHDSLSADFVSAALRTTSGDLILGHNQGGMTVFEGIRFHVLMPDTLENKIVAIAEGARDKLWIATQSQGVFYVDRWRGKRQLMTPDALNGQMVNCLYADHNRLWVGTNEGLFFFRYVGGKLKQEVFDVLPPYTSVNAILQDREDSTRVWVGTGFHGLHVLQNGRNAIVSQFDFLGRRSIVFRSGTAGRRSKTRSICRSRRGLKSLKRCFCR